MTQANAKRSGSSDSEPESPAVITADHVQDRVISPTAGAKQGYRRLDGLAWMLERKTIAGYQEAAGRRLQEDFELSQLRGGAQSTGERTSSSRRSWDIPDAAIDAKGRVDDALAVLTPEITTMTMLFLLPDFQLKTQTLEEIAKRSGEHKRAVTLGIRTALSLLARHYGGRCCTWNMHLKLSE
jgi:hypothetical protein